jgi:CMP-N-acetylneuraminic acid synthetase
MKIVAIIPARGGSKRLVNKNIYPLMEKPLIKWTIDAAKNSKFIQDIYVTTDCDNIKQVVIDDCKIIERPIELGLDHIWMQEPITHAVEQIEDLQDDDLVVILQANSPEMNSETIDKCIQYTVDNNLRQMSTVDKNNTNNSHICVIRKNVCYHKGKANYNGFIQVDWIDVHTIDDIENVKQKLNIK